MRRLSAMSIRQRLGAIGVVMALVVAGVVWLWPDDEPPAPPFPEIGFVQQGTDAPHTVVHRTARPNFDEATISYTDEETTTWEGSLAFDDADVGELDGQGGYRRRIATTSQPIGTEVSSPEWLVWHVDADADDVIDLSVFRRPLADEGALLPATQPIGFLHQPYEEYIVSRPENGQMMASLYNEGGLHPAVCNSGLFPDPGPLDPDDAMSLLETEDRTVWCTRPRQAPEPLPDEATTLGQGQASDVDESDPQGLRRTHELIGVQSSVNSPTQDGEDSDVPEFDLIEETPCQSAIREHNEAEEQADRLAEHAEEAADAAEDRAGEIYETFAALQELVAKVKEIQGDAFKIKEFMDGLRAAGEDGTLDSFIDSEVGNPDSLTRQKIDELKGKIKDEAIDLLLDTINSASTPEQIKDLQRRLVNGIGKPPHLVVLDILDWVAETAREAAEVIGNLGTDLDQEADEECGGPVNRFLCEHLPFGIGCSEEPPPPVLPWELPDRRTAVGKQEPHMTTGDGLSYDFQAVGEYTLLRGEALEVQARFSNLRSGAASVTVAAAAQLPGTDQSISIYAAGVGADGWTIVLDGESFLVAPGESQLGDYLLILDGARLRIQVDDSVGLEVYYWDADRPFFNIIQFDADPSLDLSLAGGILGDFDGDPSNDYRLADGDVIPTDEMDFETLYDTFGESWRVKTVEESLFTYEAGTDPSTFFNPRFPEGEVTLATLSQAELIRGLRPCVEGEIWLEPALSDCIFDVAVMDDEMWVETGRQVQSVLPDTTGPLALPDGLVDTHGGYVLWHHDDFEVRALIVGDTSQSTARLIVRALEVEANGSTTLIYPGWQDPPASIDLPGGRQLQLALWSEQELVVTLDGSMDGVTGLATEEGTDPGASGGPGPDGSSGGPAAERRISPEASQEWVVEFPAEDS